MLAVKRVLSVSAFTVLLRPVIDDVVVGKSLGGIERSIARQMRCLHQLRDTLEPLLAFVDGLKNLLAVLGSLQTFRGMRDVIFWI